ncbi:MAG TPA: ATP-binding protein [Ilumatobacteraceae bacterium]|nr:ATP-binding protein [Ilumatobacteraceae bacterium]
MVARSAWTQTFPCEWASIRLARQFVRGALGSPTAVPDDVVSDVELAVSELTTNGIRHGSGDPVRVDLQLDPHRVTMSVTSVLPSGHHDDPAGWGLTGPSGGVGHGIGIVRAVSTDLACHVAGRSMSASCRFPIEQ